MKITPEIQENPEILAHSMPLEWRLGNTEDRHRDRMTRLPKNLHNVINSDSIVECVVTSERKIWLGDKGLTGLCHDLGLGFGTFRVRKKEFGSPNPVLGTEDLRMSQDEVSKNLNRILKANFSEAAIAKMAEIIFNRAITEVWSKINEYNQEAKA